MAEPDPFLAVLRKHLPNADIPDHESLFTGEFMDDETQLPVADRKEQEAALKAIEAHLRWAQAAYGSLHPEVRRTLDARFRGNSIARLQFAPGTTLVVEGDPARRGAHLSQLLYGRALQPDGQAGPPRVQTGRSAAFGAQRGSGGRSRACPDDRKGAKEGHMEQGGSSRARNQDMGAIWQREALAIFDCLRGAAGRLNQSARPGGRGWVGRPRAC